jgi:hypothetical protein
MKLTRKGMSEADRSQSHGASTESLMKIALVVGSLFIVLGLFWLGKGAGLLSGPDNAVLIDVGAGVAALGIGLIVVWFVFR